MVIGERLAALAGKIAVGPQEDAGRDTEPRASHRELNSVGASGSVLSCAWL